MHQNWANFDTSLKVRLLRALRLQFWVPITTELLPKKARGAQNDAWPLCSPLPRTSNLHLPRFKSPRDNGAALFFRPARPNLILPASPPHTRILRASPPVVAIVALGSSPPSSINSIPRNRYPFLIPVHREDLYADEVSLGMLVGFENTLYTPLVRHHGGATGLLLRVRGPYRRLRDGYRLSICRLRFFCLS
jgi:hypothetical protein